MGYCLKCGNQLRDGAKFCNACGATVERQSDVSGNMGSASDYQGGADTENNKAHVPQGIDVRKVVQGAEAAVNWIQRNVMAADAPGEMVLSSWSSSIPSLDPSSAMNAAANAAGRTVKKAVTNAAGSAVRNIVANVPGSAVRNIVTNVSGGAEKNAVCPQCKASLVPGMKFCSKCGKPVQNMAVGEKESSFCKKCGEKIMPGEKFCRNCGRSVYE